MVFACSQTLTNGKGDVSVPLLTPRLKDAQNIKQLSGKPDWLQMRSYEIIYTVDFFYHFLNNASENL